MLFSAAPHRADHHHTYTVVSECGVESATGYNDPNPLHAETFEFFELTDTEVRFKASFDWRRDGYWHEFAGTSGDGSETYPGFLSNDSQRLPATLTFVSTDSTAYANQGHYVKASTNRGEAAHPCIGKPKSPISSSQPIAGRTSTASG